MTYRVRQNQEFLEELGVTRLAVQIEKGGFTYESVI